MTQLAAAHRATLLVRLGGVALVAALAAACARDAGPGDWPSSEPYQVTTDVFAGSPLTKVDLLFMVDNSNSPESAQQPLRHYFPNFVTPLLRYDLHVGIITSDLGAGAATPPSCSRPGGDQGALQNTPRGDPCTTAHLVDPADRFLAHRPDPAGGPPAVNFSGDLTAAFGCYMAVGTGGCGYEHQLASVRAALEGCDAPEGCTQPVNTGFLRRDALLAVLIFTDEDDCSAPPDSTLFDPSQTSLGSTLGPLTSYRCFEFGTLCSGRDPGRDRGPRVDCVPGNKDPDPRHQLIPVEEIATFLQGLKADPRMVQVTVVAGPPAPVAVGLDYNGSPDLQLACTGATGGADPGIRLAHFTTLFDLDRAQFLSACTENDLLMDQASRGVQRALNLQCLSAPLRDGDASAPGLQPDCVVEDRVYRGDQPGSFDSHLVPACEPVVCDASRDGECACAQHVLAPGAPGCWFVWDDAASCPWLDPALSRDGEVVGSGLRFQIDRGPAATCATPPAPPGTVTVVQCGTCAASPADGVFDCSAGCQEYWPACCPTAMPGCWP